jgi:hypothetical protein
MSPTPLVNCDEYETFLWERLTGRILVEPNREFQIMAEHAQTTRRDRTRTKLGDIGVFPVEKGATPRKEYEDGP